MSETTKLAFDASERDLLHDAMMRQMTLYPQGSPESKHWSKRIAENAAAPRGPETAGGTETPAYDVRWKLDALMSWQAAEWVHPLTCGTDSRHSRLIPIPGGKNGVMLVCMDCDYTQENIPAMCFNGPGENPLAALRASPRAEPTRAEVEAALGAMNGETLDGRLFWHAEDRALVHRMLVAARRVESGPVGPNDGSVSAETPATVRPENRQHGLMADQSSLPTASGELPSTHRAARANAGASPETDK